MKRSARRSRVRRFALVFVLAAAAVLQPDTFCFGDDAAAQRMVDSIYGADLKRVATTPTRDDDVELAKRMLASADEIPGNPAAAGLMCEHALRLVEPNSTLRPTAIQAAEKLYELAPHKRTEALDALINLYEAETRAQRGDARREVAQKLLSTLERAAAHAKQESRYQDADKFYRRALGIAGIADPQRRPWLLEQTRSLREMLGLVAEAERLMADLKADPQNRTKGARVVRVLLELDRTEEARKYSFLATERTAEMIKLAAVPSDELDTKQTLLVADWYTELAANALAEPAAMNLKWRALQRYQQLADTRSIDATTRQRITLTVSKLRKDLGPDTPEPGVGGSDTPTAGVDLKALLGARAVATRGWEFRDGVISIVGASRAPRLDALSYRFDQTANKSYTVACDIRWQDAESAVGLHLCCDMRTPMVYILKHEAVLLGVGGQSVRQALAKVPAARQWHRFEAKVEENNGQVRIEFMIDKRVVLKWAGKTEQLNPSNLDLRRSLWYGPGVVAQKGGTDFRNFVVKTHRGTFEPAEDKP